MTITAAIVLYATLWFLTLLIVLPIGTVTQGDLGEVVPGTPASAPAGFEVKRKAKMATIWATVAFVIVYGIITSGWISIRDLDFANRMGNEAPAATATEAPAHQGH